MAHKGLPNKKIRCVRTTMGGIVVSRIAVRISGTTAQDWHSELKDGTIRGSRQRPNAAAVLFDD